MMVREQRRGATFPSRLISSSPGIAATTLLAYAQDVQATAPNKGD